MDTTKSQNKTDLREEDTEEFLKKKRQGHLAREYREAAVEIAEVTRCLDGTTCDGID